MDFDQYQAGTALTAIFPSLTLVNGKFAKQFMWGYPLIGIAGEASEVLEVLHNISEAGDATPELKSDLVGELGDLFWYIGAYARASSFSLGGIAALGIGSNDEIPLDIHEFQAAIARRLDLEEPGFELMKAATSLFDRKHIGAIMEESKRVLRDDMLQPNPQREDRIRQALANTLVTMATICISMGLSLDEVAESNLAKLRNRMERGKLQGSGNYR